MNTLVLGYSPYQNHHELASEFLAQRPWSDLEHTLINPRYRQPRARPEYPTLLYVKPPISTSSVIETLELLRTSVFGSALVVDDPRENPSPSLEWYAEQLVTADAVLVHLLSNEHSESATHNTKASLISGLARGLNRPLLMLAHAPYDTPIDYQQLLQVYDKVSECKTATSSWLTEITDNLPRRRSRRSHSIPQYKLELRHISVGQPVAEHEREDLDNYFIETSPYFRALEGPTTILVGRRGTGKTAILYAMRAHLDRENRSHVTVMDPVGYELEGLIRVLRSIRQVSERGFLIESLWKYLIYSEIALSIEDSIRGRSIYQPRTPEESDFLNYCDYNANILHHPFSVRLDNAVHSLDDIVNITDAVHQRARISEQLHATLLRELREHIGLVLSQYNRLSVLIDNLDGPWSPGAHVIELTELLRGLLNVVQDIPRDLGRSNHGLQPVDARVTVLLRSDIFSFVRPHIPEQDKLPIERVLWDKKDLLKQVLDERLLQNAPRNATESEVWERLFPSSVVGLSPIDFILGNTLPRPRDVIYMVREAISNAINRQDNKVSQDDLLDARVLYSEFAFRSVLAEDDPNIQKLEEVLYEFAGATQILSLSEIRRRMTQAKVEGSEADFYLDLLCDIGFLGISSTTGFRYSLEEGQRSLLRKIASRLAANSNSEEKFVINPAFYQVLQIE